MKVAIIGTGIAGNVAAYKLRRDHELTIFESAAYVGGHTNTVNVFEGGRKIPVDTGFIVFNDRTYPRFIALLEEIGQPSQLSEMSFSVSSEDGRLEYNGRSLDALFAQRRNLFSARFYRMIRDILRFNDEASQDSRHIDSDRTVGEYLLAHGYGREFVDNYLLPMAAAIWSSAPIRVLDMPVEFLLRFFANHGLLQLRDRPAWRVVTGGSREYVKKLVAGHRDNIRLSSAVRSVRRTSAGVEVRSTASEPELFDAVFLACHSDQALQLLHEPTHVQQEVLGAIRYQRNDAILHTDVSMMPRRRKAWAAWNYHIPQDRSRHVAVTYNMNILQGLSAKLQYCVTLNDDRNINSDQVIKRIRYEHPMITREAVRAQQRQAEVNGDGLFFCGAYWCNGFHEDGVVSALNAIQHFEEWHRNAELYLRRAG